MITVKRKHILIFLWATPICTVIAFILYLPSFVANSGGYLWDIDAINDFLEMPIPTEAKMIEFDGNRGRAGYLNLSFQAFSPTMDDFIAQFCDSQLYQGYDPFNAIDVPESVASAYLITMENVNYYSYSPDTSENIFGIRCLIPGNGQVQIVVDKTNGTTYSVRLEVLYNCTKCRVSTPDS